MNYPILTPGTDYVFMCSSLTPGQFNQNCTLMSESSTWDNVRENWNNLPLLAKGGIIVGGVLLTREAINAIGSARANIQQGYYSPGAGSAWTIPSTGTLPGSSTPASQLTFVPASYAAMADSLESYMTTSGTDEEEIVDVFKKLQTTADVQALVTAFGKRPNYLFGIEVYTEDLSYWLTDEMSRYYIDQINNHFKSKGIQYAF